jgi:hypothetical protein
MERSIVRVDFAHLQNEEHVEINESVDKLFTKYDPEPLGLAAWHAEHKPLLVKEISVLDIITKSPHTAALEAQDHKRDNLVHGFRDAVKSSLNHFNPAKQEAARKVWAIVAHYGNIAAKSLDKESAAIDDLQRELAKPENAALVAELNLEDWPVELKAENEIFKNLMQERYAETAQRPTTQMRPARMDVDKSILGMLDMVEALVLVNGMANYEAFIRELNAIFERYKRLLAQRQGRGKKGETTSSEVANNE